MDITVSLDFNGEYSLEAEEVDGGSSASCGSTLMLEVDPDAFDCDDIGDNTVTLTVTASGGGSASCDAVVTVEDNNDPVIVCPANMTFPCETDISDLTVFGTPMAFDNCDPIPFVTEDTDFNINTCNVGTITREFTATDDEGNTAVCVQIVTISGPSNPLVEADITWPDSPFDAGGCIADPDSIDAGMPFVDTAGLDCFNVSIMFEDVINGNTACDGTITRTWTVIDSCQAPGGVFEFVQTINVMDVVGPDIMGPSDMTIILPPGNTTCDTFLNLAAAVSDCTGGFTAVNDSPHADDNTIADASGTYPVGETTINITATDACGNDSIYTYVVNVVDTTAFIFDCVKIIDNIGMNGTVVVDTSQAQAVVDFGNCMGGSYILSFSDMTPFQDSIVATCSDVGIATYTIYLWSGGLVIDSCTNLFQIVDGGGFCTTAPLAGTVIGEIGTEDNAFIEDVHIDLIGSPFETIATNEQGSYAFPEMTFGGSYTVRPVKDIDYLNGVSTLDLIAIQKHILGSRKLDSPYKLIAADIDRSGSISTADLLELRKLILGVYESFPSNTSWRMIDKTHKFVDPQDPFATPIPEAYEIDAFTQSMIIDFVGVKIGDVNNSAAANASGSRISNRSPGSFFYSLTDKRLSTGDIVEIDFRSDDFERIEGIQHTLKFNTTLAEFVGIDAKASGIGQDNFNLIDESMGLINMSWNGRYDADRDGDILFTLSLRVKDKAYVSELIEIDDTFIRPEAYYDASTVAGVEIAFESSAEDIRTVSLYQNVPNPWTESTQIKFFTPEAVDYTINVYDINGKLIHRLNNYSRTGLNSVELDNSIFEYGGVLYYELIAEDTRLINKMLLVK